MENKSEYQWKKCIDADREEIVLFKANSVNVIEERICLPGGTKKREEMAQAILDMLQKDF